MITSNVFQRTFFIKFENSTGTGFTIDVDNKQYLVTARHVCAGIRDGDNIGVFHDGLWKNVPVRIVGLGAENIIDADVAVLAPHKQISPSFSMPPTSDGVVLGQDVFFLGFPFGLHTSSDLNNGYPLPLVKGALVSGSFGGNGNQDAFLLDGHNNPGFSGGPVVFRPANKVGEELRVMAIVSAYKTENIEVKFQGQPTGLTNSANTGIVVCPSIKQVTDMVASNPIGADIAGK